MSHQFDHLITADQITQLLADHRYAVINVVAAWCPDCTEAQAVNLEQLRTPLVESGLMFANFLAQEQKGEFLTPLHQALVEGFGGHGYPRTVLIGDGKVLDKDNVEVTSAEELSALAHKFISLVE